MEMFSTSSEERTISKIQIMNDITISADLLYFASNWGIILSVSLNMSQFVQSIWSRVRDL